MLKKTALSLAILSITAATQASVLTTIKPLGFIANAITDGVTETDVLLPISASPHDYSLKISDIKKLNSANLIIWVGGDMETFLDKSIRRYPTSKVLTLSNIPEIKEIVTHFEKKIETNEQKKTGHNHSHSHNKNWHIWLSPEISGYIAEEIYKNLVKQYPNQKAKLTKNLQLFKDNLTKTNSEISRVLEPVKNKRYYTFHDAYGYFEKEYNLKTLGAFTLNPSIAPGAKTLEKIKNNITEHNAICIFTEPQFNPRIIKNITISMNINLGQLDPTGDKITLSKQSYFDYLRSLADNFYQCLKNTD